MSEAHATCFGSGGLTNTICDASGTTDICTKSGTAITCDLAANDDTQSGEMHAVLNVSGLMYNFWGVDGAGNDFCCELSSSSVTDIEINGVDLLGTGDLIYLYATSSPVTLDLRPTSGGSLDVEVNGLMGNDEITGSGSTSSSYTETLNGDDGDDDIFAQEGDDHLNGGDGFDQLHGDEGDDVIRGGDYGDQLYGDDGDDKLCGDEDFYWIQPNHLHGGDGDDLLWGGTLGAVSAYADGEGGDGGDGCDSISSPGFSSCSYIITSYPCN